MRLFSVRMTGMNMHSCYNDEMKPVYHIAVSAVISGILFAGFRSWGLMIASFVSGIFIDFDHIIDYFLIHGGRFKLKEFSAFFQKKTYWEVVSGFWRINLMLHGWEWLAALCLAAALTDWHPVVTGTLIGFGHHIVMDVVNHRPVSWKQTFLNYSLVWRWKHPPNACCHQSEGR